ncbi:MAG TPA: two-component regulator propeller domain-containing protein, partial [Bryobacteraceae bacterium]|nr:two-component regulator propeller domain-containing protein [Bryobacteraceae bacterium]
MRGTHGRRVRAFLFTGLLAASQYAFALNPALDMSQYAHTPWRIRDGFSKGSINSIAQTPDGYLWLGTPFGLLRFDGVRNVPWQPPADQHLPSSFIFSLLVTRDGTLWIGTLNGLASWKDGKLTHYAELAGQYIYKLLEDREGSVWASAVSVATRRLCVIGNGRVQCYGDDGALGRGAFNLYEDSKGNLWAGVKSGLWRWRPGPPRFYSLPGEPDGIQALAEGDDGTLLAGWRGGIQRLIDGKTEAYPLSGTMGQFRAHRLLRDRDGGLWIGTSGRGLLHVHQGRTDVFAPSDSLSGEDVYTLFEDREGNIWVGTNNGLDRFRDFAVPTISFQQGLSSATVHSVLAARDGSVWLGTQSGLNKWSNGQITIFGGNSGKRDGKLNGLNSNSLFQDDGGRIWISTPYGFGYLENDRFISVSAVPGVVTGIAQDTAGSLWVANEHAALFQLIRGSVVQEIRWVTLGHKDHASALAADPLQGGLWIGFHLGDVSYFRDSQVRATYTTADGLGEGRVNHLRLDPDGALWAATDGGLSRLKNGRVATLTRKNGLPCDTVHWAMEDDALGFWLYTACGLVRVARPDVDAWAAAVEQGKDTKRTMQVTVFDASDGVRILASGGHFTPQVAKSPDGKLWFNPWDGVSVIDPHRLAFNKLPPPVHIEEITADRKIHEATPGMRLPALIRDLQIDYTALSLVAPEKVKFRYKLEGHDTEWQDVGTRRQAFYNDLPPRKYRFRVIACNNSGVWNEAGASFDLFVAPAYYQTTWFLAACIASSLALLATLYRLRLRYVKHQFNLRLEERVSERTRIARDFHDTLLQSFQGVLMKFSAVSSMIPERPEVQAKLDTVLVQARQAITEGRDAVQGLRSSTVVTNDLARAIGALGEELTAAYTGPNRP